MLLTGFHEKKGVEPYTTKNIEYNGRLWVDFALSLPICYDKKIHKVLKAVLSIVTNLSDDDKTAFFHF